MSVVVDAPVIVDDGNLDLTGITMEPANLLDDVPERTFTAEDAARIDDAIRQDKELQSAKRDGALTEIDDETWQRLITALRSMLQHVGSNDTWSEVGYALLSIQHTRPARQLWIDFSRKAVGYEEGAPERWWDAHARQTPRSDYRHIFKLARQLSGWGTVSDPVVFKPVVATEHPVVEDTPTPQVVLQSIGAGKPLSNLTNAVAVLAEQTTLKLNYDEFLAKVLVQWPEDTKPRPWIDEDVIRVQWALQQQGLMQMSQETAFGAIKFMAMRHKVNCVADYLNAQEWDGVRRLSLLMPRGFGTEANRYHIRAGRNMLIAMVARALAPGCQVDEAVVLEGPQGSLKSSALRIIGGAYFAELTASPNSKDFEQQLQGVWLGEFAELNALRRVEDVARLKQFITNRTDHFRLPYGRVVVDWPRRTVLCGSTNESEWLHDPTGGRRFIPVTVGQIDLDWLRENREQLFAEAVALYKAKRKWWIYPREEMLARQEARTPEDPWIAKVREYLYGREEISDLSELLTFALNVPTERQNKAASTRLGVTLKKLGCVQLPQRRIDGVRQRPWQIPEEYATQPIRNRGPAMFDPVETENAPDIAELIGK